MNIKYRKFKTSDSKIIAEFIKNLFREDPCGELISNDKIQNTFDKLTKHPELGTIMIIEHEEEIIGYAILINFWSNGVGGNIVDIDEIYIKKEFRSKGIGTNFIKHLIENKFGNLVALQLKVTPENKKGKELYKRIGFKLHKNDTLRMKIK